MLAWRWTLSQARGNPQEEKGSGIPTPAPGFDACLFYEDDSDLGTYLFALPTTDEDGDSPENLMALSRLALFDTRSCTRQTAQELLTAVPSSSKWASTLRGLRADWT